MIERIDILGVGHAAFIETNRALYRSLILNGFNVEIIAPNSIPSIANCSADVRLDIDPIIHWTDIKGTNSRFWSFIVLEHVLNQRRPKIIYLENDPASLMALFIGKWASKNDAKLCCYTNENNIDNPIKLFYHLNFRDALRSIRFKALAFLSKKYVDRVFAICNDGKLAMGHIGLADKTTIMPLGFDSNIFYQDKLIRLKTRKDLNLNKVVIGYFGRIVELKGVHVLLEALKEIKDLEWQLLIDEFDQTNSDAYLSTIYDTLKEDWLKERVVKFHAKHKEMPLFMNASDIVVLHSLWREQYGRVVPEAMACGNAVIVSDAGALPEIVADSGLITPKDDVKLLGLALRKLLANDSSLNTYKQKANLRANNYLNIEAQIKILKPYFTSILNK